MEQAIYGSNGGKYKRFIPENTYIAVGVTSVP